MRRSLVSVIALALGGMAAQASAQGFIWNLPDDGAWVRYEGTFKQEEIRPEAVEGNLEIEWIRHLFIKSVGEETAEYNGVDQPCRWIEIKVITGKASETGIDPGPIGARIYKVLVPESKIIGKPIDDDTIPVSLLPIVRGYRRIGDGETRAIKAQALRVFPTISLLNYYPKQEVVEQSSDPGVPFGAVEAAHYRGELVYERVDSKSRNTADFWISKDIPFGLAKWVVKTDRFVKDSTDSRDQFKEATKVIVEMAVHEVGADAESELAEK